MISGSRGSEIGGRKNQSQIDGRVSGGRKVGIRGKAGRARRC